jgi:hypothetical protein
MDAALVCEQCRTPVTGSRFCTSCGAPLSGAESVVVGDAEGTSRQPGMSHPAPSDSEVPPAAPTGLPDADAAGPYAKAVPTPVDVSTPTGVLAVPPLDLGAAASAAPWLDPQPAARAPRGRPNILAVLVVGALLLSGWAVVRGVETHILSGTVMLVDSSYYDSYYPGDSCAGQGGYGDLRGGGQVVVLDDRGATFSTGRLADGEFDGRGCVFSFSLNGVRRADFYVLTIASQNRGELRYSYRELADDNWSLQLSIGDT